MNTTTRKNNHNAITQEVDDYLEDNSPINDVPAQVNDIKFERKTHLDIMNELDAVIANDELDRATLINYLKKTFNYYKSYPAWNMIMCEGAFLIIFLATCIFFIHKINTATLFLEDFFYMILFCLFLLCVGSILLITLIICIIKIIRDAKKQKEVKEKIFLLENKISKLD